MKLHPTLIQAFRIFIIVCLLLPAVAQPTSSQHVVQAGWLFADENPTPLPEVTHYLDETQTPQPTEEPSTAPEETITPADIPPQEITQTPIPSDLQPAEEYPGDQIILSASIIDIPDVEYQALLAMYNATNGASWITNSGWNTDSSPCSWFGITCVGETDLKNVAEINLASNNLVGTIPDSFKQDLIHLRILDFSNNSLAGSIPDLSSMALLASLDLSGNQFNGSIPEYLGYSSSLENLDLSSNLLTGAVPPSIGNLSQLRGLHLSLNQLEGMLPDTFSNLQNLEKLYLNGNNHLLGNFPSWVVSLPALKELNISNNLFDGPLPANIGNLAPTLILLDISHNHFWSEIPAGITKLTKLNRLGGYTDIGHNHLTSKSTAVRDFLAKKDSDWAKTQTPLNPVPVIQGLNPPSAAPGGSDLILEVRGKSMLAETKVYWNGTELSATNRNPWMIEVVVPAALLVDEGSAVITAQNPYPTLGSSAEYKFYISNLLPADGSTALTPRPKFAWPEVPGANMYQLQLSTSSTFGTLLQSVTSSTNQITLKTNLPNNRTIYWRVRGKVNDAYQDWSPRYRFQSSNAPSTPSIISPANNVVTTSYKPKLTWGSISLPTGTAFEKYELQIALDLEFTQPVLTHFITTQSTRSYLVDKDPANADQALLKPNTKYFWRVRAFNRLMQYSNWSSTRSIRSAMLPPVMIEPAHGGASQSLRPTFVWTPVYEGNTPPPAYYRIQLSLYSNFSTVLMSGLPKQAQWTPGKNLPKNKTVYWRVSAVNANGTTIWTKSSFLSALPPSTPQLVSPSSDILLTDYDTSVTLNWSVSTVPTGTTFKHYALQVSRQPNFPQTSDTLEYFVTNISNPSYQLIGLLPNSNYFWRVQAVNLYNHRSLWSSTWNIKTAMLPVTNLQVFDQIAARPNFTWGPPDIVAGGPVPTTYTIQFSLSPIFDALITSGEPTTAEYRPLIDLPQNETIYWRVRANGEFGPTLWSSSSFLSSNPPSIPVLASPENDFLSTDYLPQLTWSASSVPEGTTFKNYLLLVSPDTSFESGVISRELPTNSYTFAVSELTPNSRYYWKVRAENTSGQYSTWSTVWSFRTAIGQPVLLSPVETSNVTVRDPEFLWEMEDDSGVTSYTIQISQDNTFATLLAEAQTLSTNYVPTIALPLNKLIYWRVSANGSNGPSAWGMGSFTSANPPSNPSLVSPANGVILTANPAKLDWSSSTVPKGTVFSHYEVQISMNASFDNPQVYTAGSNDRKLSEMAWPALSGNTKYYWRVRAVGTNDHVSQWSEEWSFTTP
jgi:Leucine-rich repeat (LRR) protein